VGGLNENADQVIFENSNQLDATAIVSILSSGLLNLNTFNQTLTNSTLSANSLALEDSIDSSALLALSGGSLTLSSTVSNANNIKPPPPRATERSNRARQAWATDIGDPPPPGPIAAWSPAERSGGPPGSCGNAASAPAIRADASSAGRSGKPLTRQLYGRQAQPISRAPSTRTGRTLPQTPHDRPRPALTAAGSFLRAGERQPKDAPTTTTEAKAGLARSI